MEKENMNVTEESNVVVAEDANSESTKTGGAGAAVATLTILAAVGYGAGKLIECGVKKFVVPTVKKLFKKKQSDDTIKIVDTTENVDEDCEEATE